MSNPNDHVVDELQKLMAEFEDLAKSALAAAGQQAGGVAEELSAGLKSARERPWMAIGIAAAAAFLIGVALARRD